MRSYLIALFWLAFAAGFAKAQAFFDSFDQYTVSNPVQNHWIANGGYPYAYNTNDGSLNIQLSILDGFPFRTPGERGFVRPSYLFDSETAWRVSASMNILYADQFDGSYTWDQKLVAERNLGGSVGIAAYDAWNDDMMPQWRYTLNGTDWINTGIEVTYGVHDVFIEQLDGYYQMFVDGTLISGGAFAGDQVLRSVGLLSYTYSAFNPSWIEPDSSYWVSFGSAGVERITSLTAVPEPSTWGALGGAAVLGFALWRRSRSRAASV